MVFGIRNRDKEAVGLDDAVVKLLSDANNVLQKINRHLEPSIELIRSKEFNVGDNKIVGLLIPQSNGKTHLISKDGIFKHPSGKAKTLLQKGTFYVRRSAGNHLGDSTGCYGIQILKFFIQHAVCDIRFHTTDSP